MHTYCHLWALIPILILLTGTLRKEGGTLYQLRGKHGDEGSSVNLKRRARTHCWWGMFNGMTSLGNKRLCEKVNIHLPYDSAIPVLLMYSRKMKAYGHPWLEIFIAALFVTLKNWKQRECPPAGERIKKMSEVHTLNTTSQQKGINCVYVCVSF